MVYHASIMGLVPDAEHWFISFGWMGVDLFFVLSGFLIAGQLLRPYAHGAKPNYRWFFFKRLLRTLPAYAVILAIYFMIPPLRERPEIQPFWQFATFTENLMIDARFPTAFSHAWSLCVEEQFYLALPLVVTILAAKASSWRVGALLVALFGFGMVLRGYLWLAHVSTEAFVVNSEPDASTYMTLIYYPTWSRLDGLLAGIVLATVRIYRPSWWRLLTARPNLLLILGLLGVGISIAWFETQIPGLVPTMFAFPLLACSIGLLVASGTDSRSLIGRGSIPGIRPLAAGAYSLYLSHKIAFHLVVEQTDTGSWAPFALAMALAMGAGLVLYRGVERPFLNLRDRLVHWQQSGVANDNGEESRPMTSATKSADVVRH